MRIKETMLMRDYYRDQLEMLHARYKGGPIPGHVLKRAQVYRKNFQAYHRQVMAIANKEK